jgi:purine nucleosidase
VERKPAEPKRVIIDCDPAIGYKNRDIDDGLAIFLLLSSPEIRVEGITINFGNVKAQDGLKSAREVLRVADADVPVLMGAKSRKQLGKTNPAVQFLIETVSRFPGEISLLTLAPLTNVGTAMMIDPDFGENLKELVIMGGTFSFPFFSYFGEFNFHCDGRAASRVIRSPIPKTVITMDVCSQAAFQEHHLQRILAYDTPVTRFLAETIPQWLKINKRIFFRKKCFFPWDPVAAAYLIDPSLFSQASFYDFDVAQSGFRSGRILNPREKGRFSETEDAGDVIVPLKLDGLFISRLIAL